jgi:hypothetical protein
VTARKAEVHFFVGSAVELVGKLIISHPIMSVVGKPESPRTGAPSTLQASMLQKESTIFCFNAVGGSPPPIGFMPFQ